MSTDFESVGPVHTPPGSRGGLRPQFVLFVALIVVGVLLAFAWRLLTPYAADLGDDQEAAATVDSTLALLGVLCGVLTAVWVLLWPSRTPVLRTVTVILGSFLGGLVSWQVGDQLGTPALRAVGAAFTWPVATSAVLWLGALLPVTSKRLVTPSEKARRAMGPFGSDAFGNAGPSPFGNPEPGPFENPRPGPFGNPGPTPFGSAGPSPFGTAGQGSIER